MYRRLIILAAAMPLLLAACVRNNSTPSQNEVLVEITEVGGYSSLQHVYPGQTQADKSSALSFMVAGKVERVYVREGDRVSKGQILASLDKRDYQEQLRATQAEYQQIKNECERVIALYHDNVVSENDYDKARFGLEQITAKLSHHQAQLADCDIRAPYSGYVDKVFVSEREMAVPGAPVLSVFGNSATEISIHVPYSEYIKRSSFSACSAVASVNPSKVYDLSLKNAAQTAGSTGLYELVFAVKGGDMQNLTPGMGVSVTLRYDEEEQNGVRVPVSSLLNDRDETFVYVYDAGSQKISKCPVAVQTVLSDGSAVISGSIGPKEKIVKAGVRGLSDGMKVKALAESSELNAGDIK